MTKQSAEQSKGMPLIVGVGASAGGLEAFSTFLDHVPAASGMAFVLVQHLDPEHRSLLVELLGDHAVLPVVTATDNLALEADHVYVIPPDSTLTVSGGRLRLNTPAPPRAQRRPIDTLFESLAKDQGDNAVCVVLAGSGSDGTNGVRAVKQHGGLVLAQAETDHIPLSGMPHSAHASGEVDDVLPVESIPERLVAYRRHLEKAVAHKNSDGECTDAAGYLDTISQLLREHTGHDFSQYKDNTRIRRVQRRMQVLQADTVSAYVERLRHDAGEREALFHEMLIGVTQFFRDPDAWRMLAEQVVGPLVEAKNAADTIRVWCVGAGSGEEAYTIAILIQEVLEARETQRPALQIFATDIDPHAVSIGRTGWYEQSMPGLDSERRRRWFVEEKGGYRPVKAIRDSCIFSIHDIDRDPPFSRLDLMVCRNVLIYMSAELQDRILHKCHYALKPGGVLFLGSSESTNRQETLFEALDEKHRLFRRRDTVASISTYPSTSGRAYPSTSGPPASTAAPSRAATAPPSEHALEHQIRRAMAPYSPTYLVIDRRHTVQHFSGGPAGAYLDPSEGAASFNLFALLKKTLRAPAREAVNRALANNQTVIRDDLALHVDGRPRVIQLIVAPLAVHGDSPVLFVVALRDTEAADAGHAAAAPTGSADTDDSTLKQELQVTRAELRAALTELETTREDARSATEEHQSVNEELQSSNEELETSKEEMQSVNEELQTINAEVDNKNQRLTRANSDLYNLLESTQIATLFLDNDLRIKNSTPEARSLFHLRDSDYGRPISELASQLDYDNLTADARTVLDRLTTLEREVASTDGSTYIMHIRLYRTVANVIDGVVITFFDITERKHYEWQRAWLATIVDVSQDAIISEDLNGQVTSWNPAAERMFGFGADEAIGQPLENLLGDDATRALADRLDRSRQTRRAAPLEIEFVRRDGSAIQVLLMLSAIVDAHDHRIATALIAHDITDRVEQEQHRHLLVRELSHRVKNLLATVQSVMVQTAAGSDSIASFRKTFSERLQALADAHAELLRSDWQGADLEALVRLALGPYGEPAKPPWRLSGPYIALAPEQALALSMALHELATNAAKYGALSTDQGYVVVDWTLRPAADATDDSDNEIALCWREYGGPPVTPPTQHSFGLRLINEGLAHQLDAAVDLSFDPEGLQCCIVFVLARPSELSVETQSGHA